MAVVEISKTTVNSNTKYILKRLNESKYLYLLLILPLIYFVVFKYGAMLWLIIAFKDFNAVKGLWASDWIGLKHFQAFLQDPYFYKLIRNTVLLNLFMLVFYFPVPIVLALSINEVRNTYFKKFTQTVSYLPYFLSTVVVCGLIVNYMSTDGVVNQIVKMFGLQPIAFLMEPGWFRPIYIGSEIWQRAGWGSIIYLAALSGVDPQLYESAEIDGASRWQRIWHISIPSISEVISITFLLNLGQILSVGYEKIILLYNGSTYETADVISTYVFRRGLIAADYSYGAAVSLFQAVVSLVFVVAANYAAKKIGSVSLW